MNWTRNLETRHWEAKEGEHKLRIQQNYWGNSKTFAWEIWIDGKSYGKAMNVEAAKSCAEFELKLAIKKQRIWDKAMQIKR